MLAHGDSDKLVGKDMSAKADANGVFYAREIIENALLNNFKFTKFGWFNSETQKLDTKYVYASYIKKYEMIIGTGVYDNDVNKIIIKETLKLNNKNNNQIEEIVKISSIVLLGQCLHKASYFKISLNLVLGFSFSEFEILVIDSINVAL